MKTSQRRLTPRFTGALFFVFLALSAGGCSATSSDQLETFTTMNGVSVDGANRQSPVVLEQEVLARLESTVTNVGSEPVIVRHVRLRGKVIDLTFLHYDTRVDIAVAPGESETIVFPFEFFDLEEQAKGYLSGELTFHDEQGDIVGLERGLFDVKGNALSTVGWFVLLVAGTALLSLLFGLFAVVRGRQGPNRGVRGVRFAVSGAAIGLALALALSYFAIVAPSRTVWILMVAIGGLLGFAFGYGTPDPLNEFDLDEFDEDDKEDDDEADDEADDEVDDNQSERGAAQEGAVAERDLDTERVVVAVGDGGAQSLAANADPAQRRERATNLEVGLRGDSDGAGSDGDTTPAERRQRATSLEGVSGGADGSASDGDVTPAQRRQRATRLGADASGDSSPDGDPNATTIT